MSGDGEALLAAIRAGIIGADLAIAGPWGPRLVTYADYTASGRSLGFITEDNFDFLVEAVHLVADHGWKLLPEYDFEPETGLWRHEYEKRRGPQPPS